MVDSFSQDVCKQLKRRKGHVRMAAEPHLYALQPPANRKQRLFCGLCNWLSFLDQLDLLHLPEQASTRG